jgi:hypothetical protein
MAEPSTIATPPKDPVLTWVDEWAVCRSIELPAADASESTWKAVYLTLPNGEECGSSGPWRNHDCYTSSAWRQIHGQFATAESQVRLGGTFETTVEGVKKDLSCFSCHPMKSAENNGNFWTEVPTMQSGAPVDGPLCVSCHKLIHEGAELRTTKVYSEGLTWMTMGGATAGNPPEVCTPCHDSDAYNPKSDDVCETIDEGAFFAPLVTHILRHEEASCKGCHPATEPSE